MAFWSRLTNVFRGDRLSREIDEELQAHLADAVEEGRDPVEARRALGPALKLREDSRDVRLLPWLDSLRADAVFGWRQIWKRKGVSAAAVLSLALAIGACTAAFRLIDALLLRPLPVAGADRLYSVTFSSPSALDTKVVWYDSCSYPMFRRMRADVRDQAEAVAASMYGGSTDLTFGSDQEMEKATLQYVSGWMFDAFEVRPAVGRLLNANDDGAPGAHPYATLSYEYWSRRFDRDPKVVGRRFRMGGNVYEVVGVAPKGFSGVETGWATDVFVPMAMKNAGTLASLNNFWLRTLLILKPGVDPAPVQEKLRATFQAIQEERVKGFPSQSARDRARFFAEKLFVERAASGRSNLQRDYRQAMGVLGLLVALVLLVACANVANLMTAQASARAREMALRVSIGAGRWRLFQLVLIESAWLAALATAIGALFAWQAAPLIADMINPPAYRAHLILPADWRLLGFALALACGVMFLFGVAPAIRASAIRPARALRGGEDPHARGRMMHGLIAVQVAFCFVTHLAATMFVATFERLTNQPMGFHSERILNLETVTSSPQSPLFWEQVAEQLRGVAGVERVALIGWPLLSGESSITNISIDGAPPGDVFSDMVFISPGWLDTMRIPLLGGRDLRAGDVNPGVAIVNQSFAKQYFHGENPVGKWFDRVDPAGALFHIQVVGLTGDARSRDRLRWPIRPTAYLPFSSVNANGELRPAGRGTFVVRTAMTDPLALASTLRKEVARTRPGFRVSDARTQEELNHTDVARERLLAVLATFFAGLTVLLAGIGLYGVLDYSVLQRRREIGIRVAIGARPADIVRRVTVEAVAMVAVGAAAGLAVGIAGARQVEALLFEVRATDLGMLGVPWITILAAALLAAVPAVIRALRIDPAAMLRSE